MLLKNNSARLITVNKSLDVKYDILPGKNPAVEVPCELCKSDFVKSLINNGSLIVQSGSVEVLANPTKPDLPKPKALDDTDSGESLYTDFDKAQLVAQCEARDIEVGSRDTKNDLVAKLEAADE
ncbi:MAG: hypothetical protein Tp118SUR00d2C21406351_41 [Prokaryotic dsDNA virus sp.]|nr:MAG: hypothetical protein Tp118SUR00d2C21406351_41 [Prokaryotic dsDNA virus sp.]|tara:strand:- start:350 stop:721 length:372 start_codon:yes stop_codon:yes gene_type:complete